MLFSVYFVLGQSIVIGPSDFERLFLNRSLGIRARHSVMLFIIQSFVEGFTFFCLNATVSFLIAIFHFLLLITISFLFLLILSFTFLLHLCLCFIYFYVFSFICVFCLNLWKTRFSGVVSFWERSPTLFEVSFIMWLPDSFPFTSQPKFVNINQCTLRVRLIASEPNLRSCLMDEGLTGVCVA